MKLAFNLAGVLLCAAIASAGEIKASLLWTENGGYKIVNELSESTNTVAWGTFINTINQTGWSYLEIKTSSAFDDHQQAYGAGYLEAYLTSDLIYLYWKNLGEDYCKQTKDMGEVCKMEKTFIERNTDWVKSKVEEECPDAHQVSCNPYWHYVNLTYIQLDGLKDGYKVQSDVRQVVPQIPDYAVFFVNVWHDLDDLAMALKHQNNPSLELPKETGSRSCSAMIKVLPDELYSAHVTWTRFNRMLRVMKRYDLDFRGTLTNDQDQLPGRVTVFSGYPAATSSGDDFNAMSPSQLTSMETTIGNMNDDLWQYVKPEGTVFMFARATVANWLANSGEEWARIFTLHNSGTYNNEWMIVDHKKLNTKNTTNSESGLFWVLDQIPGHVMAADRTNELLSNTYFPSYNFASFPAIFNMSGGQEKIKEYGDWWAYSTNPRAKIFKRDQAKATDLKGMACLMRYNGFMINDSLAYCDKCDPKFNAMDAISGRGDLNPANGTYPFSSLGHRNHGGIDLKIVSHELMSKGLQFYAVSGPTDQDVTPFDWDAADLTDAPHHGLPDAYQFDAVTHEWTLKIETNAAAAASNQLPWKITMFHTLVSVAIASMLFR